MIQWLDLVVSKYWILWFAKTLADCKITDIAGADSPLFCYNSWPCFDSLSCALERCFASCGRVAASS